MKTFKIIIEESYIKEFDVDAENAEEAMNKIQEAYYADELDLVDMEISSRQMQIASPDDETTEWVEF